MVHSLRTYFPSGSTKKGQSDDSTYGLLEVGERHDKRGEQVSQPCQGDAPENANDKTQNQTVHKIGASRIHEAEELTNKALPGETTWGW